MVQCCLTFAQGGHSDGEEWFECGADDDTMTRLAEGSLPQDDELTELEKTVAHLADFPPPAHVCVDHSDRIVKCDEAISNSLRYAAATLKDYKTHASLVLPPKPPADRTLRLEYNNDGRVRGATVMLVAHPGVETTASVGAEGYIPAGNQPAYVKTSPEKRPSVEETAQLFGLCEEQAVAFGIIMDTLVREIAGEENVPQLTMSLMGHAGAVLRVCIPMVPTMLYLCTI
jgi:hypothetical protein